MKKFAIFLICFAMFCALCACGEVEPQTNASNEPAPPSAAPSGSPTAEPSDAPWMREAEQGSFNVEATDADGADISARVVELWVRANRAYRGLDFAPGGGTLENGDCEAADFDEVMRGIFTENGVAQAMDRAYGASDSAIFVEKDGAVYVPGEATRGGMTAIPGSIHSTETVSVSDDRVELLINAYVNADGSLLCRKMAFVLVRTDGGWRVDDYQPYGTRPLSGDVAIEVADGLRERIKFAELLDDALSAVRSELVSYAAAGVGFTEAVLDDLVEIKHVESTNGDRAAMWRIDFRLRPQDEALVTALGRRVEVEDGWMVLGNEGAIYIIGYETADGVWHTTDNLVTDAAAAEYDDYENIRKYGDEYGAMLSARYLEGADASTEPRIVQMPGPGVPRLADLSEYDIVEDENTVYPIIIRRREAVNISDRTIEIAKQFVELTTGETIEEVRAMRISNVNVAEARFGDDLLAAYQFELDITMKDGLAPAGGLWEEDFSYSSYDRGWYGNIYASYAPRQYAVTLNGELLCAADEDVIEEKYGLDDWNWWWGRRDEGNEAMLRAVYEEYVVGAGLAEEREEYECEMSPSWVTHRLLFDYEIKATDADGNDITAEFFDLLNRANSAYGGSIFESGDWVTGIYEALPGLCGIEQFGVEQTLDAIFTGNGRAQILDAVQGGLPLLLHREEDDTWWYPEPRDSGWGGELLEAKTVKAEDGRVEMLLTYGITSIAGHRSEVRFVMVETADGWKVDDYPHPRCEYGSEHLDFVVDGFDADRVLYTHEVFWSMESIDEPLARYLRFSSARFLGGFWAENDVDGYAVRIGSEQDRLLVSLTYDVEKGGMVDGPEAQFIVDLKSGTLVEYEFIPQYVWRETEIPGEPERVPVRTIEFTETEMLTWGLMLADVIADAEADYLAEYGE